MWIILAVFVMFAGCDLVQPTEDTGDDSGFEEPAPPIEPEEPKEEERTLVIIPFFGLIQNEFSEQTDSLIDDAYIRIYDTDRNVLYNWEETQELLYINEYNEIIIEDLLLPESFFAEIQIPTYYAPLVEGVDELSEDVFWLDGIFYLSPDHYENNVVYINVSINSTLGFSQALYRISREDMREEIIAGEDGQVYDALLDVLGTGRGHNPYAEVPRFRNTPMVPHEDNADFDRHGLAGDIAKTWIVTAMAHTAEDGGLRSNEQLMAIREYIFQNVNEYPPMETVATFYIAHGLLDTEWLYDVIEEKYDSVGYDVPFTYETFRHTYLRIPDTYRHFYKINDGYTYEELVENYSGFYNDIIS